MVTKIFPTIPGWGSLAHKKDHQGCHGQTLESVSASLLSRDMSANQIGQQGGLFLSLEAHSGVILRLIRQTPANCRPRSVRPCLPSQPGVLALPATGACN